MVKKNPFSQVNPSTLCSTPSHLSILFPASYKFIEIHLLKKEKCNVSFICPQFPKCVCIHLQECRHVPLTAYTIRLNENHTFLLINTKLGD